MGIRLFIYARLCGRIAHLRWLPSVCYLVSWEKGHSIVQYSNYEHSFKRCFCLSPLKHHKTEISETKSVSNMDTVDAVENQRSVNEADDDSACSQSLQQPGSGETKPLSKKALKRMARVQKHKEYQRQKKAQVLQLVHKDDAGYSIDDLEESSYYFENGLRKVYPYYYVFATYAKGRWVGRTLHNVLEKEFGFDQQEHLGRAFESGMIHVNSKKATPDYVLKENDYISHKTHRFFYTVKHFGKSFERQKSASSFECYTSLSKEGSSVEHENSVTAAPIEVLEDNDDVVVINKPSSIPCHPCGRYRFNSVVFILGKEMGLTNLRNIYRLDRLTSGVLIMGKSVEGTRKLMDQVCKRQVQKEYVCRVMGKFPDDTVKVDQPLQALSNKLRLQVVSPTGKPSQTTFTCISYNGRSSVVRCIPHTGRTHQIRVHLQYLGHPIINDAFYNNDAWGPNKGKGGIYEVPFDQVCARILTEHHVNLWDGGENPLYEQRLRELEAARAAGPGPSQAGGNQPEIQDISNNATKSQETVCTNSRDGESNKVTDEARHEPPSKRRREENIGDSSYISSLQLQNTQGPSESAENSTGNNSLDMVPNRRTLHLSINPETGEDSVDYSEVLRETEVGDPAASVSDCAMTSHTATEESQSQQQGFELSKWVIDPSCELCKKQPVDPKDKNLVMFLHAVKYQGPGWKYETALPDWAKDDWQREDEFGIDDLNFDDVS